MSLYFEIASKLAKKDKPTEADIEKMDSVNKDVERIMKRSKVIK